jgi:hypothetical protein
MLNIYKAVPSLTLSARPAPFAWERRVGEQKKPVVWHEAAAAAAL